LYQDRRRHAACDPIVERRRKQRTAPAWLAQSPDPEAVIDRNGGR